MLFDTVCGEDPWEATGGFGSPKSMDVGYEFY